MLGKLTFFALLAFVSVAAYGGEATAIRQAMARHDDAVNLREHKLYGVTLEKTDPSSYKFKYALVDLNGDGIKDAVVYFTDIASCGTGGCVMRVMKGAKSGFVYQSGTLRIFRPIEVLVSKSHGWESLAVGLRSGGLGVLKFNGKRYPLAPPDNRAPNSELRGAVTLKGLGKLSLLNWGPGAGAKQREIKRIHTDGKIRREKLNLHPETPGAPGTRAPAASTRIGGAA